VAANGNGLTPEAIIPEVLHVYIKSVRSKCTMDRLSEGEIIPGRLCNFTKLFSNGQIWIGMGYKDLLWLGKIRNGSYYDSFSGNYFLPQKKPRIILLLICVFI
jgi:hypothetical protein